MEAKRLIPRRGDSRPPSALPGAKFMPNTVSSKVSPTRSYTNRITSPLHKFQHAPRGQAPYQSGSHQPRPSTVPQRRASYGQSRGAGMSRAINGGLGFDSGSNLARPHSNPGMRRASSMSSMGSHRSFSHPNTNQYYGGSSRNMNSGPSAALQSGGWGGPMTSVRRQSSSNDIKRQPGSQKQQQQQQRLDEYDSYSDYSDYSYDSYDSYSDDSPSPKQSPKRRSSLKPSQSATASTSNQPWSTHNAATIQTHLLTTQVAVKTMPMTVKLHLGDEAVYTSPTLMVLSGSIQDSISVITSAMAPGDLSTTQAPSLTQQPSTAVLTAPDPPPHVISSSSHQILDSALAQVNQSVLSLESEQQVPAAVPKDPVVALLEDVFDSVMEQFKPPPPPSPPPPATPEPKKDSHLVTFDSPEVSFPAPVSPIINRWTSTTDLDVEAFRGAVIATADAATSPVNRDRNQILLHDEGDADPDSPLLSHRRASSTAAMEQSEPNNSHVAGLASEPASPDMPAMNSVSWTIPVSPKHVITTSGPPDPSSRPPSRYHAHHESHSRNDPASTSSRNVHIHHGRPGNHRERWRAESHYTVPTIHSPPSVNAHGKAVSVMGPWGPMMAVPLDEPQDRNLVTDSALRAGIASHAAHQQSRPSAFRRVNRAGSTGALFNVVRHAVDPAIPPASARAASHLPGKAGHTGGGGGGGGGTHGPPSRSPPIWTQPHQVPKPVEGPSSTRTERPKSTARTSKTRVSFSGCDAAKM